MSCRMNVFRMIGLAAGLAVFCSGCLAVSAEQKKQALGHYQLGASHLGENQLQPAFVEFQKAVEIDPANRDAQYALGHIYYMQGRYDQAKEKFQTVLRSKRDDSEAYNYLGQVEEKLGNIPDAIKMYQQALKNPLYATPEKPHYSLGVIYAKRRQSTDAIKEFREAIQINPDFPFAYLELGNLYADLGMTEDAINIYQQVAERYPSFIEANYRLALAYLKNGAKQSASTYFQKVIKEAPPGNPLATESQQQLNKLQ